MSTDDTGHRRDQSTKAAAARRNGDAARTLIVFPGALGDLLLLAPALATLARDGTNVELSVTRALGPLATVLLRLPLGPPADGAAMSSLFGAELAAPIATWWRGAGAVHVWFGRAAEERVARHAAVLGIAYAAMHVVVRDDGAEHASIVYARAVGVPSPLIAPRLDATDLPLPPFAWSVPRARRLVLHPGAGHSSKRWPRDGFIDVADAWRRAGGEAVVLLGPAERDDARACMAAALPVVSGVSLLEAAALLASAAGYVGNDSGPSHLAGAAGACGAVLFGPTRAVRWSPLAGALAAVAFAARERAHVVADVMRVLRRHLP